jgi:hypothetical protein
MRDVGSSFTLPTVGPPRTFTLATTKLPTENPHGYASHELSFDVGSYIPIVIDSLSINSPGVCVSGSSLNEGILWYAPGAAPDYLWDLVWNPVSQKVDVTEQRLAISGDYIPIVGDFDNAGCDDIMWYSPGAGADYVWFSRSRFRQGPGLAQKKFAVNGVYRPFVCDLNTYPTSSSNQIVWYAPGSGSESIWLWPARTNELDPVIGNPISVAVPAVNGDYYGFCNGSGGTIIWWPRGGTRGAYWEDYKATTRSYRSKGFIASAQGLRPTGQKSIYPEVIYGTGSRADFELTQTAPPGFEPGEIFSINATGKVVQGNNIRVEMSTGVDRIYTECVECLLRG